MAESAQGVEGCPMGTQKGEQHPWGAWRQSNTEALVQAWAKVEYFFDADLRLDRKGLIAGLGKCDSWSGTPQANSAQPPYG